MKWHVAVIVHDY